MDIDIEKRKLTLMELSDYIQSSHNVLKNTLQTLGWDESKLNHTEYKACPFNPEHQVPKESLQKHISTCQLKHEGYLSDDNFLPDSGVPVGSCILLDEETRSSIIHNAVKEIPEIRTMVWVVCFFSCYRCDPVYDSHPVPKTSDRLFASTTPDERLALYDYVAERTRHRHANDLPLELPFLQNSESKVAEPKSVLEVKAKERDAKRRSVSYKSVHTSSKTHTEIMREIIHNQMEMLQSHIKTEK